MSTTHMWPYSDQWMVEALSEARLGLAEDEEVPVGCVFVLDNETVVARGRNTVNATKNATRHAELNCIDQVLQLAASEGVAAADVTSRYFSRIVVYVNVEPCIMCASALLQMRTAAVYFGCFNERFGGCGTVADVVDLNLHSAPADYKPTVQGGFRKEEAVQLLKEFYKGENLNAPESKRKKKI